MEYINHITLNTGHIRKTYPSEIDKSVYFRLKRIYKEMFSKEGAEVYKGGYRAQGTNEPGNGTIITIYAPDSMPILTIGITKYKKSSIWELMHSSSMMPNRTNAKSSPEVPFIADRIEIGAMVHMDAMNWTGDFSRCMGWICLDPKAIR